MRSRALLQALASEGHDLTLLTFAEPGELTGISTALAEFCREVHCVPLTPKSVSSSFDLPARLRGLFRPSLISSRSLLPLHAATHSGTSGTGGLRCGPV